MLSSSCLLLAVVVSRWCVSCRLLLVLVFPRAIRPILLWTESPIRPPDALFLFVPRSSIWSQFVKIRWFGITFSVPGILENYLVTLFFFLLVIWAPHNRPAVQASDLVKDPKILLRNIYKNTRCRKEFDCTMCTALKFIPEWLLTMLPFENKRNASIFLLYR